MKVGDLVIDQWDYVYFVAGVDPCESLAIKLQPIASNEIGPLWYNKSSFKVLSESR